MPGLMDKLKGAAGAAKDKVDTMVDKAGTKMPPKVKQTYEKVSDKVEKVIPGKKDSDADEAVAAAAAAATSEDVTGAAQAVVEGEMQESAQAEETAAVAAEKAADEKAEGEAET